MVIGFEESSSSAQVFERMATICMPVVLNRLTIGGIVVGQGGGDNDGGLKVMLESDLCTDVLCIGGGFDYRAHSSGFRICYLRSCGQQPQDAAPRQLKPGDANLDGEVDVTDFNIWNAYKGSMNRSWSEGDFNGDRVVDIDDYNIWFAHKFQ